MLSATAPSGLFVPALFATALVLVAVPAVRAAGAGTARATAGAGLRSSWYTTWGKRTFDVIGALVLIVILTPLFAAIWVVLRVALGPGVVIAQPRVGRGGATFAMWKFRTMHWDRRVANLPFEGEDRRVCHKSDLDPRHTPAGRVLRKLSLDELPQLFNVVAGSMSLVGPRPEMEAIVDRFGAREHLRHDVRPGMTGEWQVSGRGSGLALHDCLDDDVRYLSRVTLRHDLALLARTAAVVAARSGR